MNDLKVMRNTIKNILDERIVPDHMLADQILMVFLVEEWGHKAGECLDQEDLTDREFRICSMWASANHNSDKMISTIRDMREIFPGLSLKAARNFVRGY